MPQKTNYAADAGRIAELQRDIRSGALSASALVERCLARIDAVDPAVQAWRHVARDSARAEADLLDRDAKMGASADRCMAFRSASRTSSTSPA